MDFETVESGSVTLRDRDSMGQIRGSQDETIATVVALVSGKETIEAAFQRLPVGAVFHGQLV